MESGRRSVSERGQVASQSAVRRRGNDFKSERLLIWIACQQGEADGSTLIGSGFDVLGDRRLVDGRRRSGTFFEAELCSAIYRETLGDDSESLDKSVNIHIAGGGIDGTRNATSCVDGCSPRANQNLQILWSGRHSQPAWAIHIHTPSGVDNDGADQINEAIDIKSESQRRRCAG